MLLHSDTREKKTEVNSMIDSEKKWLRVCHMN